MHTNIITSLQSRAANREFVFFQNSHIKRQSTSAVVSSQQQPPQNEPCQGSLSLYFFSPHLFYPSTPFLPLLLLFSRSTDYHKSLQWSSGVNTPLDLRSLSSSLVVQTNRALLSFPDMPRPPTFSAHKRKQNQQPRTKEDSNKSDSAYYKQSFFHPDYVR